MTDNLPAVAGNDLCVTVVGQSEDAMIEVICESFILNMLAVSENDPALAHRLFVTRALPMLRNKLQQRQQKDQTTRAWLRGEK